MRPQDPWIWTAYGRRPQAQAKLHSSFVRENVVAERAGVGCWVGEACDYGRRVGVEVGHGGSSVDQLVGVSNQVVG